MFTKAKKPKRVITDLIENRQTSTMKLSQSNRAIVERRRRVVQRERRRRSGFVHDYARVKYAAIYNECNGFYQELSEKYPEKSNFTKTKEYKEWERRTEDGMRSKSVAQTITLEPYIALENILTKSTTTTRNVGQTVTENIPESTPDIVAETITQEADIAAQSISTQSEQSVTENIPEPTPDIVAETITTSGNFEQFVNETESSSILQIAARKFLPDSPITIETIDRIIDEIIHDLEQDEQVRDLMGNIQQDIEEDEGIEINIDTELSAIVEPFDYQLEVEGVDW